MVALPRLPHCHNPKAIMVIVPQNEAKPIPATTATTATLKIDFSEHCHDCHDCHGVVEGVDAAASTAARLPRLPRRRSAAAQVRGDTVRGRVSGSFGARTDPPHPLPRWGPSDGRSMVRTPQTNFFFLRCITLATCSAHAQREIPHRLCRGVCLHCRHHVPRPPHHRQRAKSHARDAWELVT